MKTLAAISKNSVLLGLFAALTTALIAWTYLGTKDDIARAQREAEAKQLLEIFPAHTHDNALIDDTFTVAANQSLLNVREDKRAYRARRGDEVVGVILPATARDGYSGDISLLVGVHRDGRIAGVRVTSHRETPGLGDAIDTNKSKWILDFQDRSLLNPNSDGWRVRKDGGVFDQFTGATITPRAVVVATRKVLEYVDLHANALFAEHSAVHKEPSAVDGEPSAVDGEPSATPPEPTAAEAF
jgi:electron transport complex protein RnfG